MMNKIDELLGSVVKKLVVFKLRYHTKKIEAMKLRIKKISKYCERGWVTANQSNKIKVKLNQSIIDSLDEIKKWS